MNDTVFIKALRVKACIGVYEWEKRVRQDVVADIEMAADVAGAAKSDGIDDAIDYKAVSKRVAQFISESRVSLLETLSVQVADLIIKEFGVARVRVCLAKPGAVRGAESVGVTVERPA